MRIKLYSVLSLLLIILFSLIQSCGDNTVITTGSLRVRKNVKSLSQPEKLDYVNAVLLLKRTPSPYQAGIFYYDQFVLWHRNAFYCDTNAAHMGPAFCPWHREFLLLFENALRQVSGKNITIPYWDWTDALSLDSVFSINFMGGNGDSTDGWAVNTGPFRQSEWYLNIVDPPQNDPYGFRYLVRRFGSFPNTVLPSAADVQQALVVSNYDVTPWDVRSNISLSFRNNLEGWRGCDSMYCQDSLMNPSCNPTEPHNLHNAVHLWVGGLLNNSKSPPTGTMTLNSSPNDPVFFLHHANIDRLWEQWLELHGRQYQPTSGGPNGHNLNDNMWPYYNIGINVSPAKLLDNKLLGYKYDTQN